MSYCPKKCKFLRLGDYNAGCDKYHTILDYDLGGFVKCGKCKKKEGGKSGR